MLNLRRWSELFFRFLLFLKMLNIRECNYGDAINFRWRYCHLAANPNYYTGLRVSKYKGAFLSVPPSIFYPAIPRTLFLQCWSRVSELCCRISPRIIKAKHMSAGHTSHQLNLEILLISPSLIWYTTVTEATQTVLNHAEPNLVGTSGKLTFTVKCGSQVSDY